MVVAAPGVGKSVFAFVNSLAMRVPTQYMAMDSDAYTTCVRTVQTAQQIDTPTAEAQVTELGILAKQVFDEVDWIRFDFPSSPDTDEIARRVWAYAEIQGEYPHLIVVDNLMDIAHDGGVEGYEQTMIALSRLARASHAAVLVLHHATGMYESGDVPIPLSGLMYKVGKKPDIVLTLYNGVLETGDGFLWVCVVKNRYGPADPAGIRVKTDLRVNYARMLMMDPPKGAMSV